MREVDDLINKAKRFLRTAELAFNDGDYDSTKSDIISLISLKTPQYLASHNIYAFQDFQLDAYASHQDYHTQMSFFLPLLMQSQLSFEEL